MLRNWYLVALVCINAYFLATVVSNVVYMHRATKRPRIKNGPFVSVIVPARNEEGSIARCVESLLRQDYEDYEVIVVDDLSSDSTARIVSGLEAHDPRLRLVSGASLPDGWLGKPHALHQGAAIARGEILLLTDADTVHGAHSISWAVTNLEDHHADMLSGYLRQEYGSLGETIIVPTMYAMMLLVPLFLIPRTRSPQLAFAIGQYVAIRREALDAVGGYESIKNTIVDDMSMARRLKEFGYRGVFLDANEAAGCRLYSGYRDAFRGIERSIYSALGGWPVPAIAVAALVLALIVWPALSTLMSVLRSQMPAGAFVASIAIFAVQWGLLTWDRDVPAMAFVLYPLVFLNLVAILITSMLDMGFGRGIDWKGRRVRVAGASDAADDTQVADLASRAGKVR